MPLLAKMAGQCRGPAWGAALGTLAFVLAFLLRQFANVEDAPFAPFFLAVCVTAVFAGWRPAAAVLLASVAAAWYFHLPPARSFVLLWPQGPIAIGLFILGAGVLIALAGLLQTAARRLQTQRLEIDRLRAREGHLRHELRHRVANSVQSLAAALSLQASHLAGMPKAQAAIADAVQRLHNLGIVNRRLQDPELARERLAEALDALALELLHSMGREDIAVEVVVEAPPLTLGAATLVAMIVSEAVMNSVKHGFSGRPGGTVSVTLRQGPGALILTIGDDGHGLSGVLQDEPRFGTTIMEGFARRLGGEFRLEAAGGGGARAVVDFPLPETRPAVTR